MNVAQMDPAVALDNLRTSKPDKVTIVLLSGDMDRAMAAFIIATGAAAMGMQVTVFSPSGVSMPFAGQGRPALPRTGFVRCSAC